MNTLTIKSLLLLSAVTIPLTNVSFAHSEMNGMCRRHATKESGSGRQTIARSDDELAAAGWLADPTITHDLGLTPLQKTRVLKVVVASDRKIRLVLARSDIDAGSRLIIVGRITRERNHRLLDIMADWQVQRLSALYAESMDVADSNWSLIPDILWDLDRIDEIGRIA